MNWLNNLTIRSKIVGAFALVLIVTSTLGAFAIQRLSLVNDSTVLIADNYLVSQTQLGLMNGAVVRLRQLEAAHVMASTPETKAKEEDIMVTVASEIDKAWSVYAPMIKQGEESQIADQLTQQWKHYLELHQTLLTISRKNDSHGAQALYAGEMRDTFNAYYSALQSLIDHQINSARKEKSVANATYASAWDWIIAMIALAVLLCLAAGYFIVSGVSKPILRMTASMGRLAQHDLTAEIGGLGRKDEIGQMASAVQVFKDSMIEADRLKAEQEAAQRKTEAKNDRLAQISREFEANVGGIVQSVASQANQMEASAKSLNGTATETTQQASAVAAASEQSATNVQTVASATEELSSSISEIGRQVSHSSKIAASAVSEAGKANEMVQGLVSASQKIGEIVALINDIADQTNLLALNATIEAARAGEAGKGFAVVAAEVKNLATQTAKATEDISTQILGVQGATQNAVEAIGSIGKTIGEIDTISTAIAAAVEEQGAATQEIARNVEEVAKGSQEVSANISSVTEAANGTGAAAGQVLVAAQSLTEQSGQLNKLVVQFLADVKAA